MIRDKEQFKTWVDFIVQVYNLKGCALNRTAPIYRTARNVGLKTSDVLCGTKAQASTRTDEQDLHPCSCILGPVFLAIPTVGMQLSRPSPNVNLVRELEMVP